LYWKKIDEIKKMADNPGELKMDTIDVEVYDSTVGDTTGAVGGQTQAETDFGVDRLKCKPKFIKGVEEALNGRKMTLRKKTKTA
jgi:hypothetical protein